MTIKRDLNLERAAEILPEESAAGVQDPDALAEAVLADSDRRQAERDQGPGGLEEHRRSDEATGGH